MSPIIRVIIDKKVARIDSLLDQLGIRIRQQDHAAALAALEELKVEISNVKRQLLS